ncbi:MAG: hypothetical protein ACLFVD_03285 [Dehalococcoidia bacterium]
MEEQRDGVPQRTAREPSFGAHTPVHGRNVFTKNTVSELDLLLEELRKWQRP